MITAVASAASAKPRPASLACIETELQKIEERLLAETRSEVGEVRAVSGHTLLSGGKRLRPALAVLCARLVGRQWPENRAIASAAAAELIHMATLMHDDVVDGSDARRGRPTANSVFGNAITILTGDYLLAKSISLIAHNDENLHIVRVFSDVTVAMAEGEVLQAAVAHNLDISPTTYEEVIERKTARFLAGCCETGALVGGADSGEAARLRAYGHHLGMAFQIADDLLDLFGDPKKTGKPLGTDLRDGRVTLPLLYTLQTADASERAEIRARLSGAELADNDINAVTEIIVRRGGDEAARRVAEERSERAAQELAPFPPSVYRDALETLARQVVDRDH
jgi:octaprenyl-diphosphate synthase